MSRPVMLHPVAIAPNHTLSDAIPRRLRPGIGRTMAVVMLAAGTGALADGGTLMPRNMPAAYEQECAACHVAFPPGLLPARSWLRLMGGLDKHYGSDASLDAATLQQINNWLQAHAGTYKLASEEPPQDRLTRSAWFGRKHRKIDPSVWRLDSVKSAANCAPCHTGADRGVFDDDHLKFPEGLAPRLRHPWAD